MVAAALEDVGARRRLEQRVEHRRRVDRGEVVREALERVPDRHVPLDRLLELGGADGGAGDALGFVRAERGRQQVRELGIDLEGRAELRAVAADRGDDFGLEALLEGAAVGQPRRRERRDRQRLQALDEVGVEGLPQRGVVEGARRRRRRGLALQVGIERLVVERAAQRGERQRPRRSAVAQPGERLPERDAVVAGAGAGTASTESRFCKIIVFKKETKQV